MDRTHTLSTIRVCRICLCSDRKLYFMKKYNLLLFYENLTRRDARDDMLPQRVCWECGVRLAGAASFRAKALRSDALLHNLLHPEVYTVPDISTINREKYKLTSTLTQRTFVNHADFYYTHTETPHTNTQETDLPNTEIVTLYMESSCDDSNHSNGLEIHKNCTNEVAEDTNVDEVAKVEVKKVDKRLKPANEVLNEDIFDITDLSYEEQLYEIHKRKNSANFKNSEFKCTECFKGFLDEQAYKGHMSRHSDQCGIHQCKICKIRFKKHQALRNHTACHLQRFSCKKCTYITFRRHAAKLHEEYHNGTRYQCPHCSENFDKVSTYMSHIRIKHPSDIICELCGHSFISAKGLGLHKKLKHRFDDHEVPADGPQCVTCDVQFLNKKAYDQHLQLSLRHTNEQTNRIQARPPREIDRSRRQNGEQKKKVCKLEGPIACEQCESQLPDPLSYYRHFRRMHPDKNRTKYPSMKAKCMCEICGKMFQSLALLQDHSWTHTDSKHFKCSECDKRFQRKYRLIAHRRVHRQTRGSHGCGVCGKQFTTASNVQRHMVSHTGLKPFKCEMCGKCFKHASEKRVHVTYVHLKKPWPKRARGKRRDGRQNQLPPASDIVQPLWPAPAPARGPKIPMLTENKNIYHNNITI